MCRGLTCEWNVLKWTDGGRQHLQSHSLQRRRCEINIAAQNVKKPPGIPDPGILKRYNQDQDLQHAAARMLVNVWINHSSDVISVKNTKNTKREKENLFKVNED